MSRVSLLVFGAAWILTGIYIFLLPNAFYAAVPGLSLMGPFSIHFIRDVALAFLASGGAVVWGAWRHDRAVASAGVAWPGLHALFHVQIWGARGFPLDHIFLFDLAAVMAPALLAIWAAARLKPTSATGAGASR